VARYDCSRASCPYPPEGNLDARRECRLGRQHSTELFESSFDLHDSYPPTGETATYCPFWCGDVHPSGPGTPRKVGGRNWGLVSHLPLFRPSGAALAAAGVCLPREVPSFLPNWFRNKPGLPLPELVEIRRRSVAMLPSDAPALNRDEALELLEQLNALLREVRRLSAQLEAR
jgi:hypothetical protein